MMDNTETGDLYEEVLCGCKIAQAAIEMLLRRAEEDELRYDLQRLLNRYRSLHGRATQGLTRIGRKGAKLSTYIPRTGNCIQVYWKTLFDRSPQNVAHIIIRGFQTGEDELSDYQYKYTNAEYPAKQLCADMLSMQKQEKATFRKYLN